ncbi:MAG: sigma 54-interacting transcriptional regulator, partial [Planctomycetota bacterium]|nr:sigma 54-interacting transcriptional regulator [Planctomycetota bacterium]
AKEELLFFLNEHAAMKGFMGEHEEALRLCEEGLRLAVRSRGFAVREVALNLHATCANVASRRFDFDAAIDSYQRALEIAEAIGSSVNQAVILNNLGIVFVHSDRYGDAIEALREAESTCLRLDEGPSLATIYGNLAVLYTKRGEFEAMERCLEQARSLSPAALGRRQQFFLEHTRGVCLMYRGCYGEATNCFEAAIRFGESMGDRYVTLFDEVYRAESLVFQGRYAEATRELERLAAREDAGRVRRMAIARLAFLRALTGARPSTAKSVAEHEAGGSERKIPFLDAWDALFVGWALSVSGFSEKAQQRLSAAEGFFRRHGAAPALSLVIWIRAEGRFLAGDIQGARELLASSPGGRNDLTEFLFPLLEARLLLEGESPAAAPARAADLLARAGAALVGNRLPEWEQRFDHLRGALLGEAEYRSRVERQRAELSRELPDETRDAYLSSSHWSAWTAVELPLRETAEEAEGTAVRGRKSASTSRTASLTREDRAVARAKLVTRSSPMRHLADTLERIRETELPVLIRGETGSGKELVARIIHDESRRSAAKFQVVDCSTIPSGLLEAELFGARAGAFTDLTSDRQGILRRSAGGTVLLDEIGEFPMDVQAKLLRVIADGVIRPLGAETGERIDVRFLFSTALDLLEEVERGRFRQDLFHRIDVVSIRVPPLRERPEDLPDLVGVLLAEGAAARKDAQGGGDRDDLPELDDGAIDRLRNWPWPGNVRELKNLLSRLQLENPDRVTAADLDHLLADSDTTTVFPRSLLAQESLPALKETLERDYLLHHLRRLRGNTGALCRFLGLGRRQLYRRFERLGISLREEKRKT